LVTDRSGPDEIGDVCHRITPTRPGRVTTAKNRFPEGAPKQVKIDCMT
jgi:hypothetical protein